MSYLLVGLAAMCVSGLTLFSGFGLGTLLMPVFALFFPVEVAVSATAVVHAANNTLKMPLFARSADWHVVGRFGIPALLAAFAGAAVLKLIADLDPLLSYRIGSHQAEVTPVKAVIAVLIFIFALFELLPSFRELKFDTRLLPLGGVLSGFFGGLSGHQGALRSAFLVKLGLSTGQFVGTAAVIGFLVDLARILVYGAGFMAAGMFGEQAAYGWGLVGVAVLCAFAGLLIGRRYIRKVTMKAVQALTGALLLIVAAALGAGII
ncbi:MAG: TSUP family transporter [Candidatus Glassbacteria bacterium]|nr:TSUP family transporter [Candidatus Glassbacteria bacterium]